MPEPLPYFRYTSRSRIDKAINTLLGLLEGIAIDGRINDGELAYLDTWVVEHSEVCDFHPFDELLPTLRRALADGVIDAEERADIQWLCEKLRSEEFYDRSTSDLQRLQAILGAIASDSKIEIAELRNLREWLDEHEHLRRLWPFEEVSSLVSAVLQDGRIDADEHALLHGFLGEFVSTARHRASASKEAASSVPLIGVCSSCPEISFGGMRFCFTGFSLRCSREELTESVVSRGGRVVSGVSGKLDFLIVGAGGNPCWAYSCYGRKIERAMALRREGAHILIVHENDFHDAVADSR